MTDSNPIVTQAIEDLVAGIQAQVDDFKDAIKTLEGAQDTMDALQASALDKLVESAEFKAAQAWEDDIPEDAKPAEVAAAYVYLSLQEMGEAHFNVENIMEQIGDKINNEFNPDPAKVTEYNAFYGEILNPLMEESGKLQAAQAVAQQTAQAAHGGEDGFDFHTQVVEPEEEGGTWTVVTVPVEIKDGVAGVPETLDEDFVIGGYIAESGTDLSENFNIESFAVPAGQPIKPFVLTTADDSEAPKYFQRTGHWSHTQDTETPHVHPLTDVIPLERFDPNQGDMMAMIQQLMGGGGGGNGPMILKM